MYFCVLCIYIGGKGGKESMLFLENEVINVCEFICGFLELNRDFWRSNLYY